MRVKEPFYHKKPRLRASDLGESEKTGVGLGKPTFSGGRMGGESAGKSGATSKSQGGGKWTPPLAARGIRVERASHNTRKEIKIQNSERRRWRHN